MRAHAFASRIANGMEAATRALAEELSSNRLEEMNEMRHRFGIEREVAYLEQVPDRASLYILYREGEIADRTFELLLASNHSFDQWLVGTLCDIQGLSRDQLAPPASRLILDTWSLGLTDDVYLFAVPIAPGQLEGWLSFTSGLNGTRRHEYEESRRRIGYGERVFLQQTPIADIVIPCVRGSEPDQDTEELSGSSHPFDQWFTAEISKYHAVDFTKPVPWTSERLIDWKATAPIIV
jgi:hypothetical protein